MKLTKITLISAITVLILYSASADVIFDDPDPVQFKTELNMNQYEAFNFSDPTNPRNPVTLGYANSNFLNDDNDKLEGYLDVNDQEVRNFFENNCGTNDAVTKVNEDGTYNCIDVVDQNKNVYLNESGDTLEGDININGNTLDAGGQPINFKDGNTNLLNIKSSGAIEIPNGNLNTKGNSITDLGGETDASSGAIRTANDVSLQARNQEDSENIEVIGTDSNNNVQIGSNGNINNVEVSNANLDLKSNQINNISKAGVGTSNPQENLDVDGTASVQKSGTKMKVKSNGNVVVSLGE